ncbi:NAD(P)/FAD-dependent oxidoreductase [Ginsengibacter hankyongi]|uniref:NAD(P)/FAD-dependent oxidoreductase n=1 Tax=Ginsengibacter hankyongi TaxID=2607284 RepID=A0A5J5IIR3_9BACT|nr:NAD(P)/FAD-dependent oxidoreductase [Ginsengibacter hankyongi]KAA9040681.1 NAD(P)/FAD-dependent oxidoreductase [Ginsengibacter hankyongi]
MSDIATYDAIIVGGGPSGSTCAYNLVKAGLKTLLLDRANFPRVKLCAGWISPPIWDVLELLPEEYTRGLWKWNKVHINFRGKKYTIHSDGYFVRRYEFDDFLLKRSKAETVEGYNVRHLEKDNEGFWLIDNKYRAKYLIGAGGTHCPVARALFPEKDNVQCGTQEREFEGNAEEIASTRAGKDGEPEILLHDDMKGYSWNVPKGNWLNVGTGTKIARDVLPAWNKARAFFEGNGTPGTIPVSSRPMLDKMKGHGYIIFETSYLKYCYANNVFLIGDSLGLAQPMTGEGILPSVISGKLCAAAIAEGVPEKYKERLRTHPVIYDYRLLYGIQTRAKKFFDEKKDKHYRKSWLRDRIIVKVFAILFSGKPIPGSRIFAAFKK